MMSRVRGALAHPLVGEDWRLSAAGLGFLCLVAGLTATSGLRRALFSEPLPPVVDSLSAVLILLVVTAAVVAVVYPLGNGGPLLAAGIALGPQVTAAVVTRSLVADVDFTLALGAAGLGATVGLAHHGIRHGSGFRPATTAAFVDGAVLATVLTAIGTVAVIRLRETAGAHAAAGYQVAVSLVVLAAVGLAALWTCCAVEIRRRGFAAGD
jgi:hypothetical protein